MGTTHNTHHTEGFYSHTPVGEGLDPPEPLREGLAGQWHTATNRLLPATCVSGGASPSPTVAGAGEGPHTIHNTQKDFPCNPVGEGLDPPEPLREGLAGQWHTATNRLLPGTCVSGGASPSPTMAGAGGFYTQHTSHRRFFPFNPGGYKKPPGGPGGFRPSRNPSFVSGKTGVLSICRPNKENAK